MKLARLGTLFLAAASALSCGGGKSDTPSQGAATTPVQAPAPTVVATDPPAMPPTGHKVEWGTPGVPCTMKIGATVPVAVIVKNVGDQTWPNVGMTRKGFHAVRLGYRWWSPKDKKTPLIDYPQVRGDLRAPVPPGGSATLTITLTAPPAAGSYLLQLDLVEELVEWFENRGAAKLLVPVTVVK